MKKCPTCGHENPDATQRCPNCGGYYSKIIELIEQAAADEEKYTWHGRYRRVIGSGNIGSALWSELRQMTAGLSSYARLVLFVIFVFVFALVFA